MKTVRFADKMADKAHLIVKMTDTTLLLEHTFQNAEHGIFWGGGGE